MTRTLDVLIVDDSPTARTLLEHIVNSAPDMRVVGTANNGEDALQKAFDLRPHLILMDVIMPRMDGLEATREIMYATPTPIVLISASLENRETDIAFQAMNAGALAVHRKPDGIYHPEHEAQTAVLLNKLRLMADVRVIHHRRPPRSPLEPDIPTSEEIPTLSVKPELVAIVSSTGGPAALTTILHDLPAGFNVPIVIVQHISAEFTTSLARWMASVTPLRVVEAQQGDMPMPGHIYLAPGKAHLRVTAGYRFQLDSNAGNERHVPSGTVLLESVARIYGKSAVGIVLTGIGDDGARGLRAMYDAGAFTMAQDEGTSVVYGMPKAAYQLGAVRQVLPLTSIADALMTLCAISREDAR